VNERVLKSIHKMERGPITEVGVGKVWRKRNRAFEVDNRLIQPTEVLKALRQVIEGNRRSVVQDNCLSDDVDSARELTRLKRDHAEHV
jgi:hypothetical protein